MNCKEDNIPVSDRLDERIEKSMSQLRREHKRHTLKRIMIGCGTVAAVFAGVLILCVRNPVLASKIPLIGHIFEKVEDKISYKGEYSKNSQTLMTEQEDTESGETPNPYVQTSGGITVTVSEVYYNNKALYLAMSIHNEEGFPEDFDYVKNMEGYQWDYNQLSFTSVGKADFYDGDLGAYDIEGQFEDMHTFVGVMRIDVSHISWYPTEEEIAAAKIDRSALEQEGISTEEACRLADEYNLKLKEAFPGLGETIPVPEAFRYDLEISNIWSYLLQTEEQQEIIDGEETTVQEPIKKEYPGSWQFHFDVKLDTSKNQIAEVNEVNEAGVGIARVEKTPYEISAETIIPKDQLDYDYFMVICDANGDLLDFQGNIADTYSLYGRDTSTVYVYMCDYVQYMDELKGYYWSPDYQTKREEKTFAKYLEEKALFGTKVEFE